MDLSPAPANRSGRKLLGRQALATAGAAALNDLAAVLGGHARAEAVTALAHESARLIGPLHEAGSGRRLSSGAGAEEGRGDRRSRSACQSRMRRARSSPDVGPAFHTSAAEIGRDRESEPHTLARDALEPARSCKERPP